jgi:hypothetical protein
VADVATGEPRVPLGKCELPGWSPDGARIACASEADVFLVAAGTQKEIERVRLPELAKPHHYPQEIHWSPDGEELLLGVYGENANSTTPQSDFIVLDLAARTWAHAGSGNDAWWLPGREAIVYSTPRNLVPLPASGEHSVWSSQLAMFDLTTHKQSVLTSGLTNNLEPALCRR